MTDQSAALDDALQRVIEAAREHLAAVRAADGAVDDERVWQGYVALNNASYAYDQLLLDTFGEVTPWDTELIEQEGPAGATPVSRPEESPAAAADPYPSVVSVRQRRDFQVPSVSALLAAAGDSRRLFDEEMPAPGTVGEAVLGLVQAGDGSLGALDLPVLEPLQGVVTVSEVTESLGLETVPDTDAARLFHTAPDDRLVARLDEYPYLVADEIDDADEAEDASDEAEDASDDAEDR